MTDEEMVAYAEDLVDREAAGEKIAKVAPAAVALVKALHAEREKVRALQTETEILGHRSVDAQHELADERVAHHLAKTMLDEAVELVRASMQLGGQTPRWWDQARVLIAKYDAGRKPDCDCCKEFDEKYFKRAHIWRAKDKR
jgi:hypothetical protein